METITVKAEPQKFGLVYRREKDKEHVYIDAQLKGNHGSRVALGVESYCNENEIHPFIMERRGNGEVIYSLADLVDRFKEKPINCAPGKDEPEKGKTAIHGRVSISLPTGQQDHLQRLYEIFLKG